MIKDISFLIADKIGLLSAPPAAMAMQQGQPGSSGTYF